MVNDKVNARAEEFVRRKGDRDATLMGQYMCSGDSILNAVIQDIKDGTNKNMLNVFEIMKIDGVEEARGKVGNFGSIYSPTMQNQYGFAGAVEGNADLKKEFETSYQKLKNAVIATSNDKRLEKTAAERAVTITKKMASFVTNIVAYTLNIVGRQIESVGNLVHIVPVAAQLINRMPVLSKKSTQKDVVDLNNALGHDQRASNPKEVVYRKNIIERVGQAMQDGVRVASDKANPITAAFAEADKVRVKHHLDKAGVNYGGTDQKPTKGKSSEKQRLL